MCSILSFGKTTLRMRSVKRASISLLARILIMKKIPIITENTFEKSPEIFVVNPPRNVMTDDTILLWLSESVIWLTSLDCINFECCTKSATTNSKWFTLSPSCDTVLAIIGAIIQINSEIIRSRITIMLRIATLLRSFCGKFIFSNTCSIRFIGTFKTNAKIIPKISGNIIPINSEIHVRMALKFKTTSNETAARAIITAQSFLILSIL